MSPSRNTVLCVILNWNGGTDTQQCVQSVLASQDANALVLVVDNGSTDGSPESLLKLFPSIVLVKNNRNLGVARGFNQGVQYAVDNGYQQILFLNNDAVVARGCIAALVATLSSDGNIGIVSPRILDSNKEGRIWFDGGALNMFGDPMHKGFGKAANDAAETMDEEHATGCAMLVSSSLLKDVVECDERFFAYSEDTDFCLKAREHGWKIRHNPNAIVTHRPSSSVRANKGKWFRDYYVTRNKLLLMRIHTKGARWVLFLSYFSFKYVLLPIVYFIATGQFRRMAAVVSGVHDFIVNRFGERYS